MTPRATALLIVCGIFIASASGEPMLFIPALTVTAVVVLAILVDQRRAPSSRTLSASRVTDPTFSVGRANRVVVNVVSHRGGVHARVVDEHPVDALSSGSSQRMRLSGEFAYTVTPRARGVARFGNVVVRATGPWGLAFRQSRTGEPLEVPVDADLAAIGAYEALTRRGQLAEIGIRAQRRRAEGTEFERVRDAVPDDPLRFVNWRATARTGHLMTTEFRPERNQPLIICLDHSRLMGVGAGGLTKLDTVLNAAVLLAHVALRSGDRVGLLAFADTVTETVKPEMGPQQLRRILDAMRRIDIQEIEADYDEAMLRLDHWQRRRALLAIFTDIVDVEQSEALARHCARLARRHLPVVITVRDRAIDAMATARPADITTTYERAIADGLIEDRSRAIAVLRAAHVDVIDADPATLSPRMVDRYLSIKRRAAV